MLPSSRSPASNPRLRTSDFGLWTLVSLIGFWTPWLTHPAASLRLNGFELSEWVTFLPGVRDGSLAFGRLTFLAPLACLALLAGIAASRCRSQAGRRRARWLGLLPDAPLGWGLLLLALLCLFAVFPPYAAYTQPDDWPEYRLQFIVACAAGLGLTGVLLLPDEVNDALQIAFALVGGAFGLWTVLALWPIAFELLRAPWAIGYGWAAMLTGFMGLVVSGLARIFGPRY